jgi:hypothetical protein
MLGIDRELLWRKLFAFDHEAQGVGAATPARGGDGHAADADADADADTDVDALCRLIQDATARGQQAPLRRMLQQRLGYWVRADVAPPFWRFFRDAAPLLAEAHAHRPRQRRAVALYCAEQLTLALQFAEEAFAHCVQIASLFDCDGRPVDGERAHQGVLVIFLRWSVDDPLSSLDSHVWLTRTVSVTSRRSINAARAQAELPLHRV